MEDYCLIQALTFWPQEEETIARRKRAGGAEKSPSAPQPWCRGREYIWEGNWAKAASPSLAWGIRMASTQSRNLICKLTEKQSIDCSPHTQPAQILWQKHGLCFWKGTVTTMKNYSQLGQEGLSCNLLTACPHPTRFCRQQCFPWSSHYCTSLSLWSISRSHAPHICLLLPFKKLKV